MATVSLNHARAFTDNLPVESSRLEYYPPAHCFLDMPDPATLPRDGVGRQIVIFLFEHPSLAGEFGGIDLATLTADEKAQMLARMKSALGIPTFLRDRLPYMGG